MHHFFPLFSLSLALMIIASPPLLIEGMEIDHEMQASVSLLPDKGAYHLNDSVPLNVYLHTPDSITSLKLFVTYDPTLLSLSSVNTQGSIFSYWWEKKEIAPGKIELQASTPTPGFQGLNGLIAKITFRALGDGFVSLSLDSGSLVLTPQDRNVLDLQSSWGSLIRIVKPSPRTHSSLSFSRNLRLGDQGPDVKALQQLLNSKGFLITPQGVGSPGNETEYFGLLTQLALIKFQEAYASQILAPLGLAKGTGLLGSKTRAELQKLLAK